MVTCFFSSWLDDVNVLNLTIHPFAVQSTLPSFGPIGNAKSIEHESSFTIPIGSMYGAFPYIYNKHQLNVGKYTIHGSYCLQPLNNYHHQHPLFFFWFLLAHPLVFFRNHLSRPFLKTNTASPAAKACTDWLWSSLASPWPICPVVFWPSWQPQTEQNKSVTDKPGEKKPDSCIQGVFCLNKESL